MTPFWLLAVTQPADLAPLADALEEAHAYQWAGSVRRLIAEGRWPKEEKTGQGKRFSWRSDNQHPDAPEPERYLPYDVFSSYEPSFRTPTAAVWAVITSSRYLEDGSAAAPSPAPAAPPAAICDECLGSGWNADARRCSRGCASQCGVCGDPECGNPSGQH